MSPVSILFIIRNVSIGPTIVKINSEITVPNITPALPRCMFLAKNIATGILMSAPKIDRNTCVLIAAPTPFRKYENI